MHTLGIGLIGAGKHGLRYLRHLTERGEREPTSTAGVDGARLVALTRRDRDAGAALAARHGCAFHADWHALVADPAVDAVVTVVPPTLNAAIAEAACRAGKHLLIEKPLAGSLDDARRIARAVAESRVRAMVAHTLRFDATVAAARDAIASIAPLHALTLVQRFEPSPLPWLDRVAESGGGVLLHTGIHSIDLLRAFTAHEVVEVACVTSRLLTRETEDNFVLIARFEGGELIGSVAGSRALGARTGLIELAGAGGHIVADHVHGEARLIRGSEGQRLAVNGPVPTVREVLRAFVGALRGGGPMPITIDDGLRALAIADAGYRSAALGGTPQPVSV